MNTMEKKPVETDVLDYKTILSLSSHGPSETLIDLQEKGKQLIVNFFGNLE